VSIPPVSIQTVRIAAVIAQQVDGDRGVMCDEAVARTLLIRLQAVREALLELERLGALTFTRLRPGPGRAPKQRTVVIHSECWVWTALAQHEGGVS
jgi:hypothetical protein